MRERASLENEQNVITLSTDAGEMVFKQIAGWIARRVVCWKKEGERVARGERIGLVRFGSRVDLWVPREAEILVSLGVNVKGGSSVVARWPVKPQGKSANEERISGADAKASLVGQG
jgi:phosphatidylserine decarboxylase